MVGHGGNSAGSYLADPTSPIPSHCASIVSTSTLRVNNMHNEVYHTYKDSHRQPFRCRYNLSHTYTHSHRDIVVIFNLLSAPCISRYLLFLCVIVTRIIFTAFFLTVIKCTYIREVDKSQCRFIQTDVIQGFPVW